MAYRADIEIAVRGAQQLRQLQKEVGQVSDLVQNLNNYISTFGNGVPRSVDNLRSTLNAAKAALNNAALGTSEATAAADKYVLALNEVNQALAEQQRLVAAARRAQSGIVDTPNQYSLPAMPGRYDTIEQARIERNKRLIDDLRKQGAERRTLMQLADREAATEARINAVLERRAAIQQRNRANREGASNAIIGGAFPLLFGQGVGAAVGGGLGGFAGGRMGGQLGFGLSLVGTAVGGLFDQATTSASDFSKSLRAGGDAAGYLEQRLGSLDSQTRDQIRNLQASGQTARAAELAFNELANQIGVENAQAFRKLGDSTNTFSSGFQRLVTTVIAGAARLDTALKPVTDRLGALSLAVPGVNAAALTRSAADFIRGQGRTPSTQPAKTPEAVQRETALRGEVSVLQQRLQLTAVSAQSDLQSFVNVSRRVAQQENAVELQKIENEYKRGALTLDEMRLQKSIANLKLQQNLGEIERQRVQEERRRAEEAKRAAEQAAQQQLQNFTTSIQLENEIRNVAIERNNTQIEIDRLLKGESAALAEQMRTSEGIYALKIQILSNERQVALATSQNAADTQLINELYKQRAAVLQGQQYLEQQRMIRLNNELKLEKELNKIRRSTQGEQTLQPIFAAKEQAQLGIQSFFTSPQAAERLRTESEQRRRAYDSELPILNEILRLNTEIASGAYVGDQLEQRQLDLENQQALLSVLREELVVLDQLEMKQLALKQTFEEYGVIINGVSGAIADAMTMGVNSIVAGTSSVKQVFADLLQSVGNALLQYAQQAIATYIAIGIARIFAGLGGGGGSGNLNQSFTGDFAMPDFMKGTSIFPMRAGGGAVSGQKPYMVGEQGPELFVPGTSGSVVSTGDLRAAMGSAPGSNGTPVLNMSFETTSINGMEYVSRDQLEAAMEATRRQAARDGAKRGMSMTLDRLQQSPNTRRRVGI